MKYTIEAIDPNVRSYQGKFGSMSSYKVKFKESENWVEVSQKTSTPAPVIGSTMDGTIDMSGQYGPKFNKEYSGGGGGAGKRDPDSFTMYLSYAKDIVVAMQTTDGFDEEKFKQLIAATITGGKNLFNNRPGAATTTPPSPAPAADIDPFNLDKK